MLIVDDLQNWTALGQDQPELKAMREQWCSSMKVIDPLRVLMVGIWGDAAPYNHRDSLYLLLYNVLSGSSKKRYWLTGFPKKVVCRCGCSGKCTFDVVWKILQWSFDHLRIGRLPLKRHDGTEFKDSDCKHDRGWRDANKGTWLSFLGGVFQKRGDWSWLKQALSLQGWKEAGRVCFKCPCTASQMREFSLSASWRHAVFNHARFLSDLEGRYMPLLGLPGFQLVWIMGDMMHNGCLGVVQYVVGNILWVMFGKVGGLVTRPEQGLCLLLSLIHQASKALGITAPINSLTLGMIRPKNVMSKLKAAEGRHMLPVLQYCLTNFFKAETDHDSLVGLCLDRLCQVYAITEPTAWNPSSSPAKLGDSARRFSLLYAELSRIAIAGGDTFGVTWRIVPKFHMFLHTCEDSIDNPRDSWCYKDESEIGTAVTLAESLHPSTLPFQLMSRYRL